MSDYGPGRKNQYFVPGKGIAREVITADICKYLDNDATVRPMDYQGQQGYMIYAYRNLTSAMIEDLKKDTILWEKEQRERKSRQTHRSNAAGPGIHQMSRKRAYEPNPDIDDLAYVDSKTHERRQMHGPSVQETPSPGISEGYGPRPPGMGYEQRQPSPQHEPSYAGRGHAPGYPTNTTSPGFAPGYPTAADPGFGRGPEYNMYPPEHGFGVGGNFNNQGPPMPGAGRGGFPPHPAAAVPPGVQGRDPRFPYDDPRQPHGMPPGGPGQFPPDRDMGYGHHPADPRTGYDPRYPDRRYRP